MNVTSKALSEALAGKEVSTKDLAAHFKVAHSWMVLRMQVAQRHGIAVRVKSFGRYKGSLWKGTCKISL